MKNNMSNVAQIKGIKIDHTRTLWKKLIEANLRCEAVPERSTIKVIYLLG